VGTMEFVRYDYQGLSQEPKNEEAVTWQAQ